MTPRTARRHRQKAREGRPVVISKGRRQNELRDIADAEYLAFVAAVFGCVESGEKPTSANLKIYPLASEDIDEAARWRRPSEEVMDELQDTNLQPVLLAVAAWDIVKSIELLTPHGGRTREKITKKDINPDACPWDQLTPAGQKLALWAYGEIPERERSIRRRVQKPPRNLLDVSTRMLHHWRHHPDFRAASRYVYDKISEIATRQTGSRHCFSPSPLENGENVNEIAEMFTAFSDV